MKKGTLLILVLFFTSPLFAQKIFSGIVIDSASFEELSNVIVHVKNTVRRTITSTDGRFSVLAHSTDTLSLTLLGYYPVDIPLYFEEDVLLIRMSEQIRILDEITIRSTRLYPNEIVNRTKALPKKMTGLQGAAAPFDYFQKLEREKRKLTKVIKENNKIQTYVQVITDPIVKTIMMDTYKLNELVYYERLAIFNQQHPSISYSTDPEEIMEALHDFFQKSAAAAKH